MERTEIPSEITSYYERLRIHGISMITAWGNDDESIGFIEMKPFDIYWSLDKVQHITDDEFNKEMIDKINDGGFGCKHLLGAHCYIEACYTNGTRIFIKDIFISKDKKLTKQDCKKFEEYEY